MRAGPSRWKANRPAPSGPEGSSQDHTVGPSSLLPSPCSMPGSSLAHWLAIALAPSCRLNQTRGQGACVFLQQNRKPGGRGSKTGVALDFISNLSFWLPILSTWLRASKSPCDHKMAAAIPVITPKFQSAGRREGKLGGGQEGIFPI